MKNKLWYLFLIFGLLISCSKNKKDKPKANDYNRGELTIFTDDSFKSVTEALADAYMINYPETHLKIKVMKEDLGLLELLHERAKLIVMSREMTKQEISEYERITDLKYLPAKFAADAVVFIVPASSSKKEITLQEISDGLKDGSKKFIADGANAGNINFIAQKLKKNPADMQFSVIPGNENIIKHIAEHPEKIGIISLNTISREYSPKTQELLKMIKILPVSDKGKTYMPATENLITMEYPFTRVIYFLGNEGNFQLANGIMRFSATQLGQMVVQKEGLQPYNLYRREVQFNP